MAQGVEVLMELTDEALITPQGQSRDSSVPAPNWFLYWRASKGLWRQKLSIMPRTMPIVLPFAWGLHYGKNGEWDFGEHRSELSIFELINLAHELGHRVVLGIAVGPMPMLPNGGIPQDCAKVGQVSLNGQTQGYFDQGHAQFYRYYSFFSPDVLKAFRKTIRYFSQACEQNCTTSPGIVALNFGALNRGEWQDFFQDNSVAFHRGFERYLEHVQGSSEVRPAPHEVFEFERNYREDMAQLYLQIVRDLNSKTYVGKLDINCIGQGDEEVAQRFLFHLPGTESIEHAIKGHTFGAFALVTDESSLNDNSTLTDIIARQSLIGLLGEESLQIYEGELDVTRHLRSVVVGKRELDLWKSLELESALNRCYKGAWGLSEDFQGPFSIISDQRDGWFKVGVDALMRGDCVFIVSEDQKATSKQLHQFRSENDLEEEVITVPARLSHIRMGEGRIISIDAKEILGLSTAQRLRLWQRLFDLLGPQTPDIELAPGMACQWMQKSQDSSDMEFVVTRRLAIYNPTSYKTSCKIRLISSYVFLRTIDSHLCTLDKKGDSMSLQFGPGGRVFIDFGYYPAEEEL